jgi:hypothetical protein
MGQIIYAICQVSDNAISSARWIEIDCLVSTHESIGSCLKAAPGGMRSPNPTTQTPKQRPIQFQLPEIASSQEALIAK